MLTGGRCSLPAMPLTKNGKNYLHSVCACSTSHGQGRAPIQATCWRQCGRGSTRSRPMGRQIWQSPSPGASAESSSTSTPSSAATASSSPAGVAPHFVGSDNHTTPHHTTLSLSHVAASLQPHELRRPFRKSLKSALCSYISPQDYCQVFPPFV